MRRTVTGILKAHRNRKGSRNWVKDFGMLIAEEAGRRQVEWYPTLFWLQTDEPARSGNRGKVYQFSRTKPPAFLTLDMAGCRVSVDATVEEWEHNGLGGYLKRPTLKSFSPFKVTP